MIKIAFVIDTIESPTAGTERQLLLLIKNLDRTKFEPYLCVLRTSKWVENEFSWCKVVDIDFSSFKNLKSYFRLWKFSIFLRKSKINIVQTYFKDGNKVGIIAGFLAGVQSIISTRRNQGYWHTKFEIIQLNLLNKKVDFFLANCQSTKEWVTKTEKVNHQKIFVIYNLLESGLFYRETDEKRKVFRKNLGFSSDSTLIGLVANLRPVKSINLFIKAASIVIQSCPQTGFVIVGEGPERAALEQLTQFMNLTDSVCFLGKSLDVPSILSCLDIGVQTSSSESFSNSIIEYMAAGLAVVCTDVGGVREVVEDEVNGLIVQSGSCKEIAAGIKKIIRQKSSSTMGKRSKEKVEKIFSVQKIMDEHQKFYEQIFSNKK